MIKESWNLIVTEACLNTPNSLKRLPSLDHYLNAKIKDIKWLLTDTAD